VHIWNPYFHSREYEIEIKSGEKSFNDEIEMNQFKKTTKIQKSTHVNLWNRWFYEPGTNPIKRKLWKITKQNLKKKKKENISLKKKRENWANLDEPSKPDSISKTCNLWNLGPGFNHET